MERSKAAGALSPSDEAKLIDALRAGEDDAYAQLVRRYGGRLLAVTRRLLREEEDARDAVQEAFLSAFKSIGRFEAQARLSTWLHRIAVNAALMKLRSKRRRPETSIEELLPGFVEDGHMAEPPQPWREGADTLVARRETRDWVRGRIDELPESHRTVLVLRDIEELDTTEVAELLDISPGAVKTRLHRARQALRSLLDRDLREKEA
jgi:RNA polymerase sigma-70 factor (ECF subfamily)